MEHLLDYAGAALGSRCLLAHGAELHLGRLLMIDMISPSLSLIGLTGRGQNTW